ncbi:MAG: hypothetical protein QXP66_00810 [Candidatus Aenigmatarchaeota archaeon]
MEQARQQTINILSTSTNPEVLNFKNIIANENNCWNDFVVPFNSLSKSAQTEIIDKLLSLNNNYINVRVAFLVADNEFAADYLARHTSNKHALCFLALYSTDNIRLYLLQQYPDDSFLISKIIAGMKNKSLVESYRNSTNPLIRNAFNVVITNKFMIGM